MSQRMVKIHGEPFRVVDWGTPGEGKFFGRCLSTVERVSDGARFIVASRSGRIAWNARLGRQVGP